MGHEHHHHSHSFNESNVNRAFLIGMLLNAVYIIIEFAAGFYYNSLSLLSDAGHNLSDVASLGLSLIAFKLAKKKSKANYTYGYSKGTILASLTNAVILLIAVGSIGWEAILRFIHPTPTNGISISIVAGIGIGINLLSAFLFLKEKDKDLNIKGAYLHLMVDAMVSVGVVVAGILIYFTSWLWLDPLISVIIMIVVLSSTWSLLKESLRLTLDGAPQSVNIEVIKKSILNNKTIEDVHHIHIWAISTTCNALTAHMRVNGARTIDEMEQIKHDVKHELLLHNIQHVTLEIESHSSDCDEHSGCD